MAFVILKPAIGEPFRWLRFTALGAMAKRSAAMSDGGCENMPAPDFVGLGARTLDRTAAII